MILIDTLVFDAVSMGAPANPDYIVTLPRYACLDIADVNISQEARFAQVLAGIDLPQWILEGRLAEFKTDQALICDIEFSYDDLDQQATDEAVRQFAAYIAGMLFEKEISSHARLTIENQRAEVRRDYMASISARA